MAIRKRICIVCGKEYEYCNTCKDNKNLPAWLSIYHGDSCREIMHVATEFLAGNISKAEAKKRLESCDIKNKKNFSESIRTALDKIYTKKVVQVEFEQNKETEVQETEVQETEVVQLDSNNVE